VRTQEVMPEVGISELWFDEKGAIYVNIATASLAAFVTRSRSAWMTGRWRKSSRWIREGAQHTCFMWKKVIYTCDMAVGKAGWRARRDGGSVFFRHPYASGASMPGQVACCGRMCKSASAID